MITVDPDVVVTVPPSYTVCSGNVVCLSASATGGAMTYSWTPGTSLSSTTTPNPCASPLFTTTYTVTVTNGTCTGTATTTVYVDGPVTATIATMNTTDCTVCNGSATVTASGGSAPYAYYWTPAGVTTVTDGSLCVGSYSVIVTDINGCTAMANTVINADNGAASNFTVVPDSTNAYNFFFFNSSVGAGASYYWEFGDGAGSPAATPSHTYGSAGTMTVCLTTNSSLCSNSDTLCLPVTVSGSLASCVALFNIADDTTSSDPNALYVYNLSYGATLSYLWDFGDGSTSTLAAPSHVYSGTGPYNLCLTVDNGAGCSDTYCDMLTQVDSLNRSMGLSIQVFDVPPFQGLTTSADAMNPVESVDVFPNPFSETTKFSINDKNNDVYSFELKDVLGKKVIERSAFTEKQFAVSRDGLREGIYFYRISSSKGVLGIGKVIVR
jgi:PKD repeat protein